MSSFPHIRVEQVDDFKARKIAPWRAVLVDLDEYGAPEDCFTEPGETPEEALAELRDLYPATASVAVIPIDGQRLGETKT